MERPPQAEEGVLAICSERSYNNTGRRDQMKTVLITGASRGIGAAMAASFGRSGYQVAINYCNAKTQAEQLCMELQSQDIPVLAVQADVADQDAVLRMVDQVQKEFGFIDTLINNAGIGEQKLFTDLSAAEWKRMMAVHVDGAFYCTQAVLPPMISQKRGCVINISSIWGVNGASCEVHYSTAKAALIGFTKALAREVGPSGIRINCIAPGVIQTEMNSQFSAAVMQELTEEIALCKLGHTEDIAGTALFLASEQAGFITGQILTVDGGMI